MQSALSLAILGFPILVFTLIFSYFSVYNSWLTGKKWLIFCHGTRTSYPLCGSGNSNNLSSSLLSGCLSWIEEPGQKQSVIAEGPVSQSQSSCNKLWTSVVPSSYTVFSGSQLGSSTAKGIFQVKDSGVCSISGQLACHAAILLNKCLWKAVGVEIWKL